MYKKLTVQMQSNINEQLTISKERLVYNYGFVVFELEVLCLLPMIKFFPIDANVRNGYNGKVSHLLSLCEGKMLEAVRLGRD